MEPPEIAYPKKADTDANYLALARMLLENRRKHQLTIAIATHDEALIKRIEQDARYLGLSKDDYEVQFLYGIKSEEQERLVKEGHSVRVLINYGSYWFPWYVRRLAERPANVFFVLKNLISLRKSPTVADSREPVATETHGCVV